LNVTDGGVVSNTSARVGGNRFDEAIQEHMKRSFNLAIGERTAENVKIKIGSALYMEKPIKMEVMGRDMVTGLPRIIEINSNAITEALQDPLRDIINAVKRVLFNTPPELSADVMDKGMVLSGGTSLLRNFDKLLTQATGVEAYLADDSLLCVARGTGIALENLDAYKRSILSTK